MTDQTRVPAGDSRGGQFASSPRPEAATVLDQVYREDEGTFHYPPAPRTYDQLLKFWSNVEIPDESLTRFKRGYAENVGRRVQDQVSRWEAENPQPTNQRRAVDWEQQRDRMQQELTDREPRLYATWVRPLVRLERMYAYSRSMHEPEQAKFLQTRYSLPVGPSGTVEELLDKFRVHEYSHVLHQTSLDDNDALVQELKKTTAQLAKLRAGV